MDQRNYGCKSRRCGFTLIELLVVIAVIAILAALLFPVFSAARRKSHQAACMSNLRQIALGFQMYKQDYDSYYPYWDWNLSSNQGTRSPNHLESLWINAVYPYVKNAGVFACPSAIDRHTLRQNLVWSWTDAQHFDSAGIADGIKDAPVNYGMSEMLSTGEACDSISNCSEGGIDRPSQSLLVADCLQGLTNHLDGRPNRNNPNDPRHNYIISRVAFANGPYDCYQPAVVATCGAAATGSIADFGTNIATFDTQTRHQVGSVVCFTDGHTKWLPAHAITYDLFAGDAAP